MSRRASACLVLLSFELMLGDDEVEEQEAVRPSVGPEFLDCLVFGTRGPGFGKLAEPPVGPRSDFFRNPLTSEPDTAHIAADGVLDGEGSRVRVEVPDQNDGIPCTRW